MLKASVSIATSVDGFITRPNGDIVWLPPRWRGGPLCLASSPP
jgi:hypothetical protein